LSYKDGMRAGAISVLILWSISAEGHAQNTTTYLYDTVGRLRSSENTRGVRSSYDFDKASNRTNATARANSGRTWEAEGLPHSVGYADRDGWAANVNTMAGHMTYGPYVTDVQSGQRTASWKLAIDVRNASNDQIATLDVYDATSGEQLAFRIVKRLDFIQDQTYQTFDIPFSMTPQRVGHSLEFRTYYHGSSYIILDKISLY
jgi:YD repeat-containing protein